MARCQFGLQSWCCSLISPPGEFHDALLKVCTDWDEGVVLNLIPNMMIIIIIIKGGLVIQYHGVTLYLASQY